MKVLILGATGFVGEKITRLLLEEGFDVHAAGRDVKTLNYLFPRATILYCDFLKDLESSIWLPRLRDIDIIINCVGIFYHPNKKIIWDIHHTTPCSIYKAAQESNVKQIIHISALGVNVYANEYAHSKKAIEDYLNTLTIPHVILRPSFIYGPGSQGGMKMIRNLASLPGLIPIPGEGRQMFQPIYVGDLARAIKNLMTIEQSEKVIILAAVSSKFIEFKNMVKLMRQWLGLKKAILIKIPFSLIRIIAWFGDAMSFSTMNTPAIQMLEHGNYTTKSEAELFQKKAQIRPLNFEEGIHLHKAQPVERWYPRLNFIRPLLKISLAIMWLLSAFTSVLAYSTLNSYTLLKQVGIPLHDQALVLYGASILNALIGLGLLLNYKIRFNCIVQLFLITAYTVIISIKLPFLWLEPFGPVVKNLPILMSVCLLYVLESS